MTSSPIAFAIVAFVLAILVGCASAILHYKFAADIPMEQKHYIDQINNMNIIEKPCDVTDAFDEKMKRHNLFELLSSGGLFLSISFALIGIIIVADYHVKKKQKLSATAPTGTLPKAIPANKITNTIKK